MSALFIYGQFEFFLLRSTQNKSIAAPVVRNSTENSLPFLTRDTSSVRINKTPL